MEYMCEYDSSYEHSIMGIERDRVNSEHDNHDTSFDVPLEPAA